MGSFRLNGVKSHLISTLSYFVVFLKGFVMYSIFGNPVSLALARLGLDAEGRKLRSLIRRMARCTQIITVTQAVAAVMEHDDIRDCYESLLPEPIETWDKPPSCSATNHLLRRKVLDMLESFEAYWVAIEESPAFQQQCLLEMKRLAPPADPAGDDLVVFEMRSDLSFDFDCMRLYRPPVLAHRVRKNAAESVYTRSVYQTPRWVYTMLHAYVTLCGSPAFPYHWNAGAYIATVVSDPSPYPATDVLAHALQFWLDAPSDGVYIDFAAALAASQLLV